MTKKNAFLVGVIAVLAVVYVVYFTDWFKPKTIQIFHISRNLQRRAPRPGEPAPAPVLIFVMNQKLRLDEIKVVSASEFQTNREALPLWHLISSSNSVPVKQFIYGQFVRGMKPAVPGLRAEPLETNVTYHLIVLSGKMKGEHDFDLK